MTGRQLLQSEQKDAHARDQAASAVQRIAGCQALHSACNHTWASWQRCGCPDDREDADERQWDNGCNQGSEDTGDDGRLNRDRCNDDVNLNVDIDLADALATVGAGHNTDTYGQTNRVEAHSLTSCQSPIETGEHTSLQI